MRFFERVDEFILAGFTRFSHWFQRLTGRTNFFLARIGLIICMMSACMTLINYFYPILTRKTNLINLLSLVLVGYAMFYLQKVSEDGENRATHNYSSTKISLGISTWMRLLLLFFSGCDVVSFPYIVHTSRYVILDLLREDYASGGMIYFYFISVDPLPPGVSRIRQWLEGLRASFKKLVPSSSQS